MTTLYFQFVTSKIWASSCLLRYPVLSKYIENLIASYTFHNYYLGHSCHHPSPGWMKSFLKGLFACLCSPEVIFNTAAFKMQMGSCYASIQTHVTPRSQRPTQGLEGSRDLASSHCQTSSTFPSPSIAATLASGALLNIPGEVEDHFCRLKKKKRK